MSNKVYDISQDTARELLKATKGLVGAWRKAAHAAKVSPLDNEEICRIFQAAVEEAWGATKCAEIEQGIRE